MTLELTGGLTNNVSLGMMLLAAHRPGGAALDYAGWRILPHFYAPKSWKLPVNLGLIGEFGFHKLTNDLTIPHKYGSKDLARLPLSVTKLHSSSEDFTISFDKTGGSCTMRMSWENTQASVEFAARNTDLPLQD